MPDPSESDRPAPDPSVPDPTTAEAVVDALLDRYRAGGGATYLGEPVTQAEHSLQAAALALAEDAPDHLVAAAFLHDLGHLLDPGAASAVEGADGTHDRVHAGQAARHLAQWFPPEVTEPVRLHVEAKRCLADDPAYRRTLSPASEASLQAQGGVLDAAGRDRFLAQPFAGDALRVRRWDDRAKVPGAPTPTLDELRPVLLASLDRGIFTLPPPVG